jgi:hypothetical protein
MLKAFFAMESFTWAKKKKIVIHGGGAFCPAATQRSGPVGTRPGEKRT